MSVDVADAVLLRVFPRG